MNYRRLLDCFRLIFRLTINYAKYAMISLNCNSEWKEELSSELGYLSLQLLVMYLRIPLRAIPKKGVVWELVLKKDIQDA